MDYSNLLTKALDIQKRKESGIYKDSKEYAFVFVYPPPQALQDIDQSFISPLEYSNEGKPVNIYIHIPYCTGKCKYCYFCCYALNDSPVSKPEYVSLLCNEIELARKRYGKLVARSIHFGGGTPTTLSYQEISTVLEALSSNLEIPNDIEITFESSPETINIDKLKFLRDQGVNRLNIGIQSLNDNILQIMGRRHSGNQALSAIEAAQEAGFQNINVDLIYGMPEQSVEMWTETLTKIIDIGVQSISTYRLRIHPKGKLANGINYLDESELIKMYVLLLEIMDKSGYVQSSSHKFALQKEFVQKQIISKRGVKDNELISFGLSSYGYLNKVLYWNSRTFTEYRERILSGQLPYSLGYRLNDEEEAAKACVLGVHNLDGIDVELFGSHFGKSLKSMYPNLYAFMESIGLAELDGGRLKLTKLGMIFADEIAIQFYSTKIKNMVAAKNLRYGIFFDEIIL